MILYDIIALNNRAWKKMDEGTSYRSDGNLYGVEPWNEKLLQIGMMFPATWSLPVFLLFFLFYFFVFWFFVFCCVDAGRR